MRYLTYLYIVLFTVFSFAQEKEKVSLSEKYILIKIGDTLNIDLEEVKLFPKNKFSSPKDAHYYQWFRKKIFKAYPLAILASERLDTLVLRLSRIKSKRKQKRYIKIAQQYLEGEFTDLLKKMTRTEGRILIKLLHRQTGKTAFKHVKDLRSGWRAFWYNTSANIFSLSLKEEYHPENNNEDFLIEDILQRAFAIDALEEYPSKLDFNFVEIATKKKGNIDVEAYKKMFSKLSKKKEEKQSKNK